MLCHKRYARWIINGTCIFGVSLLLALCLLNVINTSLPTLRCHGTDILEPDLSHKVNGETITVVQLAMVVLLIPYAQFLITELYINRPELIAKSSPNYIGPPSKGSFKKQFRKAFYVYCTKWYSDYIFGLVFTTLLTDVVKTTMNSPRPHFLDTCKPNFAKEACKNGWLENYECSNTNISRWRIVDSHKSFPSGHATIAMYSAFYMIFYQHITLRLRKVSQIVLMTFHTIWLSWGLICSASRVVDFKHHPQDIICGGSIGIFGAVATVFLLSRCFQKWQPRVILEPNYQARQQPAGAGSGDGPTIMSELSSVNSNKSQNGDVKRQPSLRRLLSQQSTMTTMSDISEDDGNENYQV